jgi:hypothetical protein
VTASTSAFVTRLQAATFSVSASAEGCAESPPPHAASAVATNSPIGSAPVILVILRFMIASSIESWVAAS